MPRTIFDDFGITFGDPAAPAAEHPQRIDEPTIFDDFNITFDAEISPVPAFDPEGSDYDYTSAEAAGLQPDQTGHWPSRDPNTGLILKGRGHETFDKTIQGEQEAGYEIYKGEDGRYYSQPKPPPTGTIFDDFGITFQPQPEIRRATDDVFDLDTLGSLGRGIVSGGIDFMARTPATMIEMIGRELETRNVAEIAGDWVRFASLFTPILGNILAQPAEKLVGWMTNTEEGEAPGELQQAIGGIIGDVGQTAREFWDEKTKDIKPDAWWADKKVWDNPEILTSPTWWAYNLGNIGTNLAATILPAVGAAKVVKASSWAARLRPSSMAKLAKMGDAVVRNAQKAKAARAARLAGMAAGGAAGGMLESTNTYSSVIEAGGTHEEALRASQLMFWAVTALNAISVGKWLEEPALKLLYFHAIWIDKERHLLMSGV